MRVIAMPRIETGTFMIGQSKMIVVAQGKMLSAVGIRPDRGRLPFLRIVNDRVIALANFVLRSVLMFHLSVFIRG